jgi:hypothetical protein
MRRLTSFVVLAFAAVSLGAVSFPASRPAGIADEGSVSGVWKMVSVTVLRGPQSGMQIEINQPSLSIFTKEHFATVFVSGMQPRVPLPEDPTDEQLLAAWRPVQAMAGTYEIVGGELRTRLIVSKSPNETAEGTEETSTLELDGDALYRTFMDEQGDPALRVKFVRVE